MEIGAAIAVCLLIFAAMAFTYMWCSMNYSLCRRRREPEFVEVDNPVT
jgi:hypothetical protein